MNGLVTRTSAFDDFFKDFAPGFFVKPLHGEALPASIKVDVHENKESYELVAEMPGVNKDDIHVTVDGNVVTLRAEVKQRDEQSREGRMLRSERYYGSVARSFQLPQDIDQAGAKAKCDNGVLTLTLPKKAAVSSTRLTIE